MGITLIRYIMVETLGEFALKRPFQQCLLLDFELLLCGFQAFDAFIQTAEPLFYFGYYAVLLGEGREGQFCFS